MNEFRETIHVLRKCCQQELRQPLPDKQIFSRTDAEFQVAGYEVLTEDDLSQLFTSTRKRMPRLHTNPKHLLLYN